MAYRSPSPNPSRAQSPRPKTPEPTIGTRKYPAANPSPNSMTHRSMPDLSQRNADTKGLVDQKENERGSNGSALKRSSSPSTPSSKGTKNFMSPTFSAMSKVISSSASSKRRILGERNDAAVRSSLNLISDSDASGMLEEVEQKKTDLEVTRNSSDRMKLQETIPESDIISCNLMASDSFKFKKSVPELKAPQSSAPSSTDVSPYDLEKNYLSPRPRFLHYKPNPRIELYRNRKEELFGHSYEKQLEDSSSVESWEADSVMTEDSENDGDDALASGLVEEEDECERPVLESKPCCKPSTHRSSRTFQRPRLFPLVLMLVAASLLIPTIDTPSAYSSPSLSIHQPFRKLYVPSDSLCKDPNQGGFLSRVKAKFAMVCEKAEVLQFWSSANYLTDDPISHIGIFQVINSTVLIEEEGRNAGHNQVEQRQGSGWDYISMDYLEDPALKEAGVVDSDEKGQDILEEIEAIEQVEEEEEEGSEEDNQFSSLSTSDQDEEKVMVEENMQPELVSDHTTEAAAEEEEDTTDLGSSLQIQQSSSFLNDEEQEISDSAQTDDTIAEEDTFSEGMQFDEATHQDATSHESESKGVSQSSINQVLPIFKLPVGSLIAASSVIISLATVLLSLYLKQTQTSPDPRDISPPLKKVTSSNPDGISQGRMPDQSPLYRSYPIDAQTMVESCGPEMSSTYHNTASNCQLWRKGGGSEDEILSYERSIRRDSTASSTSYGSFTTYERLSGRKGSKDDALTPVRRSSRIRSQVTSP